MFRTLYREASVSLDKTSHFFKMIRINDLLSAGCRDIQITVTLNDLLAFADHILASIQMPKQPEVKEEELMTRQQVMEYLKIKPTTLFNWNKKGILVPSSKIGRKVYYKKSDILALQRGDLSAKE